MTPDEFKLKQKENKTFDTSNPCDDTRILKLYESTVLHQHCLTCPSLTESFMWIAKDFPIIFYAETFPTWNCPIVTLTPSRIAPTLGPPTTFIDVNMHSRSV